MWLGMGHMVIGNALIGVAEWGLLVWLGGKRRRPSGWSAFAMIGANYVSAWAGVFLLRWGFGPVASASGLAPLITRYFPQPLYQAGQIIAWGWASFFVLTIIVEWGFVHWAMATGETQRPRAHLSLRNTLIVNLASYAVLTWMYLAVSPSTLATQVRPDPTLGFARDVRATVYYLGDDGDVCSVRGDGSQRKRMAALPPEAEVHHLALLLDEKRGTLDLVRDRRYAGPQGEVLFRTAARALVFPDLPPPGSYRETEVERPVYDGRSSRRDWRALDLRPVGQTAEAVRLGTWAAEGISLRKASSRRASLHLALETPFLAATPSGCTVLENDLLICQYSLWLGTASNKIVALDLRNRVIGVLAEGRSPVVVLDAPPAGAKWWVPGMPSIFLEEAKRRGYKP